MKGVLIKDANGQEVGTLEMDDSLFAQEANSKLIHQVVLMYQANKRVGTASTKRRGEVAGSGRKPYAQKHTGRARAGTLRSPLWRKGGIVFGPHPRDYSFTIPKKAVRAALAGALQAKFADGEVAVVDSLSFPEPKTKEMVKILKNLNIEGSCLVVVSDSSQNVYRSARNIPGVGVVRVQDMNALDVLRYKRLLLTREAAQYIKSRFVRTVQEKTR
jgi:large subunit ribosomal protein L4